jgi:hypothetical protein
MGVDVDTGGLPSGHSIFETIIGWIIGHGTISAAVVATIVLMTLATVAGGAVQEIFGRFKVVTGLIVVIVIYAGWRLM